jgi:PRTRC genetic system protein C
VREFHFNGTVLGDPDPGMKPDEVRKVYAASGYPTLTNATVTGPEFKNGKEIYNLKAAVGTKG